MTRLSLDHWRTFWHHMPGWLRGMLLAATLYLVSTLSTLLIGPNPLGIIFMVMLSAIAPLVSPFLASPSGVLEGIPIIITAVLAGGIWTSAGGLIGAGHGRWVITVLLVLGICTLIYGIYTFFTQPFRLF
jgi:hypothetical protein